MPVLRLIFTSLGILFIHFFSVFSSGQSAQEDTLPILFDSDKILELTISLNLDSLYNGGFSEQTQYKGKLTCIDNEGDLYTMPVYFTKRGHFRKSFKVCDFPPLQVHFSDKYSIKTPFERLRKIKMITHCQNNDSAFEQYVIQEYLFYKVYNILTDYSFKVRLAKVQYIDISGKYPEMEKYAFFIENSSDLAYRRNGMILDIHYLYPEAVDQYHYLLMSLFQYVIINQDWSISLLHNVELVGVYPSMKPVTVPFDFDMAWLINIPYNSPTISYRKGKQPERSFWPKKVNRKMMAIAIYKFKLKQDEILNLFRRDPILSETNKIRILASLEAFYQCLNNEKWVKKEFMKPARR